MRQIVVRRFKSKTKAVAALVLDEKETEAELDTPNEVVVLARRDLIFLQALFAALDRRQCINYKRMQKAVSHQLDTLTR